MSRWWIALRTTPQGRRTLIRTKTCGVRDIARHHWMHNRNGIRRQVINRQRRYYMTAFELQDRFEGVKISVWSYWKKKSKNKGRTSYHQIQQYLIRLVYTVSFPKSRGISWRTENIENLDNDVKKALSRGSSFNVLFTTIFANSTRLPLCWAFF